MQIWPSPKEFAALSNNQLYQEALKERQKIPSSIFEKKIFIFLFPQRVKLCTSQIPIVMNEIRMNKQMI